MRETVRADSSAYPPLRAYRPGRAALNNAHYYRRRAAQHYAQASRAAPVVAAIHHELARRYLAAATACEQGVLVDFDGEHRADRAVTLRSVN